MDQESSQPGVSPAPALNSVGSGKGSSDSDSSEPRLVVIYDSPQECPYIEGEVSRTPLEFPRQPLQQTDLDVLLERGYRRTGNLFYRTQCPTCTSCIPVRVDVAQFRLTKSMRRILNRGRRELKVVLGPPVCDEDRLRLYNDHRINRDLSRRGPASLSDYRDFLVSSCVSTMEIAFYQSDRLVGVSIVDLGQNALNVVYTHFDPQFGRYSIGTLAVLEQIDCAIQTRRQFVFLGLYVAENRHLN